MSPRNRQHSLRLTTALLVTLAIAQPGCSKKGAQVTETTASGQVGAGNGGGINGDGSSNASSVAGGPVANPVGGARAQLGVAGASRDIASVAGTAAVVAAGGIAGVGSAAPAAKKGFFSSLFGGGDSAATRAANAPAAGGAVAVNSPVAAVPGSNGAAVGSGAAGASDAPAPAKPKGPSDTCFTVSYAHKKLRTHSDDEDCGRHKNLLTLAHPVKSMTGLCVRVNGSPVRYQTVKGKGDQVIIGPVAGPLAKIAVRYCVGKVQCAEECKIPKDEFMDAIGGSEDSGAESLQAKAGQWDPEDAKLTGELNKELQEIETISAGASQGTYVFGDWISDAEAPACGGEAAARTVAGTAPDKASL